MSYRPGSSVETVSGRSIRRTKIEWHDGELFPRIGFIVTNSNLPAGKVAKVYNDRGDVENRINEGKNTLR